MEVLVVEEDAEFDAHNMIRMMEEGEEGDTVGTRSLDVVEGEAHDAGEHIEDVEDADGANTCKDHK